MKKTHMASNILDNISNSMSNRRFSSEKGKALVVFTGSTLQMEKTMNHIFDIKKAGYDVAVGFSFMAENLIDTKRIVNSLNPLEVLGEEDLLRLQIISNDYSLLVMPNITMNTLSKVCSGMIDSFASNILWAFLYKNKQVLIDFYSVRNYLGDKTASKEIESMIEEKIDYILKLGAEELEKVSQVFNDEEEKEQNFTLDREEKIVHKNYNSSKNLITQNDIVNSKASKIIINKNTIVTPLARDKARELNMDIVVE